MHAFTAEKAVDSNPAASVGVQTWSRGEIFPAIVAKVEVYDTPMTFAEYKIANSQLAHHDRVERFYSNYLASFFARELSERETDVYYEVTCGQKSGRFGTRVAAEAQARVWLAGGMEVAKVPAMTVKQAQVGANQRALEALAWIASAVPGLRRMGVV